MKLRLLAALTCTAFSLLAIVPSVQKMEPLWLAAWMAYGAILFFWVRDNRAPKGLLVVGTLVGLASVISSPFFVALYVAAPGILLMLHVIRCSWRLPAARS